MSQKHAGTGFDWGHTKELSIEDIKKVLPHRYPFLLVDRVLEISNEHAVGMKNVTANEPFFQGHFPERFVMPGVLIVEAMAQIAGLVALKRLGRSGQLAFLAGIDGVRFREPVVPGDRLVIETRLVKEKARLHVAEGTAKVGDKVVCEGTVMFVLLDETKEK